MLVMRPTSRSWWSCAARASGDASAYSSGGMRAIVDPGGRVETGGGRRLPYSTHEPGRSEGCAEEPAWRCSWGARPTLHFSSLDMTASLEHGSPVHQASVTLRLTGLHVYPIKSAAGLAPAEWPVDD